MKNALFIPILVLTCVTITACSTDSEPDLPAYTLTIEITPEGAGTTNPLPGGFDEGANLELEAIPAENYLFDRWEGDLTTESNPADLTMNSDKVITAVFKREPLTMGGDGSQANPYQVHTLDDLVAIGLEENLDKHYIQVADIDASESEKLNNGSGFTHIGDAEHPFTGVYDGDGFVIRDLHLNFNRSDSHNGLFGYAKNAEIVNVIVDNSTQLNMKFKGFFDDAAQATKHSASPKVAEWEFSHAEERGIAGLVGTNDGGLVSHCYFKGRVKGDISQAVAGLVGINSGTIEHSSFEGEVSSGGGGVGLVFFNHGLISDSSVKARITGQVAFGFVGFNVGDILNSYADIDVAGSNGGATGFVGRHESGTISSSFVRGRTFSGNSVAGFVNSNNAEIHDVYSATDLVMVDFNDNRTIAGFVVTNEENGNIENSYFTGSVEITGSSGFTKAAMIENLGTLGSLYWDMERSDLNDAVLDGSPDGATGLSTAEMRGPAAEKNMPGFDWVNIWRTTEGGYPKLRWEEE